MLEFVGLQGREDDKIRNFSHGMKQRLGIAQTLLHDPDLIILDEPTTGLDPQGIIHIRNLILQLKNEKGKTVLLSSHILSEIELIANRMVIISKGKSIVEGDVSELLNQQELVVTLEVDDTEKACRILVTLPWIDASNLLPEKDKILLHIARRRIPEVNSELLRHEVKVYGIEAKRKLEDYFLKLIND
jgi:ABC-type multidrug transport system ATPase subunit